MRKSDVENCKTSAKSACARHIRIKTPIANLATRKMQIEFISCFDGQGRIFNAAIGDKRILGRIESGRSHKLNDRKCMPEFELHIEPHVQHLQLMKTLGSVLSPMAFEQSVVSLFCNWGVGLQLSVRDFNQKSSFLAVPEGSSESPFVIATEIIIEVSIAGINIRIQIRWH